MQIEERATDTLLERGVTVQIAAPLLFRVFGKRTIKLKVSMPTLGNKLRINRIYLRMHIEPEQLQETTQQNADVLMIKHGKKVAQIAAIGMLKGYWMPLLFSRLLGRYLVWKLPADKIFLLVQLLVVFSGTSAFMSTIRLVRDMKITAPNLSHQSQGS